MSIWRHEYTCSFHIYRCTCQGTLNTYMCINLLVDCGNTPEFTDRSIVLQFIVQAYNSNITTALYYRPFVQWILWLGGFTAQRHRCNIERALTGFLATIIHIIILKSHQGISITDNLFVQQCAPKPPPHYWHFVRGTTSHWWIILTKDQ